MQTRKVNSTKSAEAFVLPSEPMLLTIQQITDEAEKMAKTHYATAIIECMELEINILNLKLQSNVIRKVQLLKELGASSYSELLFDRYGAVMEKEVNKEYKQTVGWTNNLKIV